MSSSYESNSSNDSLIKVSVSFSTKQIDMTRSLLLLDANVSKINSEVDIHN